MTDRVEVLTWLGAVREGAGRLAEVAAAGWTFEDIGDAWLDGVEERHIGRGRGRGKPYSPTTVEDYRRSYRHFLRPEFGPMVADEISELEWQMWVDRLSREASRGPAVGLPASFPIVSMLALQAADSSPWTNRAQERPAPSTALRAVGQGGVGWRHFSRPHRGCKSVLVVGGVSRVLRIRARDATPMLGVGARDLVEVPIVSLGIERCPGSRRWADLSISLKSTT